MNTTRKKLKLIENSGGIGLELPKTPLNKIMSSEQMSKKIQELWQEYVDIKSNKAMNNLIESMSEISENMTNNEEFNKKLKSLGILASNDRY